MLDYTIAVQTKPDMKEHLLTPYYWALVPPSPADGPAPEIKHCGWEGSPDLAYQAAAAKLQDLCDKECTTADRAEAYHNGFSVGRVDGAQAVLNAVNMLMNGHSLGSVKETFGWDVYSCPQLIELCKVLNGVGCSYESKPTVEEALYDAPSEDKAEPKPALSHTQLLELIIQQNMTADQIYEKYGYDITDDKLIRSVYRMMHNPNHGLTVAAGVNQEG